CYADGEPCPPGTLLRGAMPLAQLVDLSPTGPLGWADRLGNDLTCHGMPPDVIEVRGAGASAPAFRAARRRLRWARIAATSSSWITSAPRNFTNRNDTSTM